MGKISNLPSLANRLEADTKLGDLTCITLQLLDNDIRDENEEDSSTYIGAHSFAPGFFYLIYKSIIISTNIFVQ